MKNNTKWQGISRPIWIGIVALLWTAAAVAHAVDGSHWFLKAVTVVCAVIEWVYFAVNAVRWYHDTREHGGQE